MREEILFEMTSLSREPMRVKAFKFGKKDATPSCVIVGPMTGDAIDQLWIASRMVRFLRQKELEDPTFVIGEVVVIPTANTYSFNMGKSFWPLDNTDIDVMFPGYEQGETTQRIAARLFKKTNNFDFAILLEARKDHAECMPYVSLLSNGAEDVDDARAFGLEFIHIKESSPIDTVSINYNWKIWNARSFSIVSGKKGELRKNDANKVFDALIRFMSKHKIIDFPVFEGSIGNVVTYENIEIIKSSAAGLFDTLVSVGDRVVHGQPLARIYNALDGTLMQTIVAPFEGIISCAYDYPLIFQNAIAFRVIRLEETQLA